MHSDADEFIILTGGLVTNEPSLPVFDLDALDADVKDPDEVGELYRRLYEFAAHLLGHERISLDELPASLVQAIKETEAWLITAGIDSIDREIIALARTDGSLREDLVNAFTGQHSVGARLAEVLAARALGTIGIAVLDTQRVLLTDAEHVSTEQTIAISPRQLLDAVDQYRLVTGDELDLDAIEAALDWA